MVAVRLAHHQTAVTTLCKLWHLVELTNAAVPQHATQSLYESMTISTYSRILRIYAFKFLQNLIIVISYIKYLYNKHHIAVCIFI